MSEPTREPTPEELVAARRGTVRREPRYARFLVTGVVVGLVAAVVVAVGADAGARFSQLQVLGYLSLTLGLVGGLLGGVLAVVLARQATSRTRRPASARKPTRGK